MLFSNQIVSITIGILVSYWLDYGTNYIGGTRCAPGIPYTGGPAEKPVFDPYKDVGLNGCNGQSDASWRVPLTFQILPALILGAGTLFFPDSPRWLFMKDREEEGRQSLAILRQKPIDHPAIETEFLEIKASVILENTFAKEKFENISGVKLHAAQVGSLQDKVVSPLSLLMFHTVLFTSQHLVPIQTTCNWMFHYVFPTVHGMQWYAFFLFTTTCQLNVVLMCCHSYDLLCSNCFQAIRIGWEYGTYKHIP